MADSGDAPRRKFVVGVYNPDVPNSWDYALSQGFDFACAYISRPQLRQEALGLPPSSAHLDQVLFRNALLKPEGQLL